MPIPDESPAEARERRAQGWHTQQEIDDAVAAAGWIFIGGCVLVILLAILLIYIGIRRAL